MPYRSIKRALLETSLERKCRILFFSALLLLIGTAFWFANWQAESLVIGRTQQTARDWINIYLMDLSNVFFKVAVPTTYVSNEDLGVTQKLAREYAFITGGEVIMPRFNTHGKIRDLELS